MSSRGIAIGLFIPASLGTVSLFTGIIIEYVAWEKENENNYDIGGVLHVYIASLLSSAFVCLLGSVLCLLAIIFSYKTAAFGIVIFPSYLLSIALLLPWIEIRALLIYLTTASSSGLHFHFFILTAVGSFILLVVGCIYLVLTLLRITAMRNQIYAAGKSRNHQHVTSIQQLSKRDYPPVIQSGHGVRPDYLPEAGMNKHDWRCYQPHTDKEQHITPEHPNLNEISQQVRAHAETDQRVRRDYPPHAETDQRVRLDYPPHAETDQRVRLDYPPHAETDQRVRLDYPPHAETDQRVRLDYPPHDETDQRVRLDYPPHAETDQHTKRNYPLQDDMDQHLRRVYPSHPEIDHHGRRDCPRHPEIDRQARRNYPLLDDMDQQTRRDNPIYSGTYENIRRNYMTNAGRRDYKRY